MTDLNLISCSRCRTMTPIDAVKILTSGTYGVSQCMPPATHITIGRLCEVCVTGLSEWLTAPADQTPSLQAWLSAVDS